MVSEVTVIETKVTFDVGIDLSTKVVKRTNYGSPVSEFVLVEIGGVVVPPEGLDEKGCVRR